MGGLENALQLKNTTGGQRETQVESHIIHLTSDPVARQQTSRLFVPTAAKAVFSLQTNWLWDRIKARSPPLGYEVLFCTLSLCHSCSTT